MEDNAKADRGIREVLTNLDVILVGVGTPFAIDHFIKDEPEKEVFWIGIGYFLTLFNFFHAKFNLNLADEFSQFSNASSVLVNFLNLTLRVVLSGSFIFMAFYFCEPASFIHANLVMRTCDLIMVVMLLATVNRLNLTEATRKDLKRVHKYWLAGTLFFFGFYFFSLWQLAHTIWAYKFAVTFASLAAIDTALDYYRNRNFYFRPSQALSVDRIVNERSSRFRQVDRLLSPILGHGLEECERAVTRAADFPRDNVWCATQQNNVVAVALTRTHYPSPTLELRHLFISDPKQWLQLTAFLVRDVLSRKPALRLTTGVVSVHPQALFIHAPSLSEIPPDIDLAVDLKRIGFRQNGKKQDFWFLWQASSTPSPTVEEQAIEEWRK
jgi:hypothetical protein